jgi:peptide/nickel transport system ATP-binding protein
MTTNIGSVSDRHPAGTGPVLDIDHLKVTFATDAGDVHAVKDVSLEVKAGEVLAIVGESGSGKTVTAKTILGLLPETAISSGAVVINGNNVISVSPGKLRQIRGRDVAMVFQEPSTALNPVFTVGWQIAEGILAHAGRDGGKRVTAKEAKARAIEALRKVGIPDPETRVNYYPHQFSGGQKQRVVIAAALALNPGLIVADEPTTALDVTVQAEILELLRDLRDKYGTSIVLITHNMGVVADLADRVVVMYQGDVVEEASAKSLFAEPRQDYTRKLLAAVPHLGRHSASEGMTERAHQDGRCWWRPRASPSSTPAGWAAPPSRPSTASASRCPKARCSDSSANPGPGKTTIGRAIAGLNRTTGGSLNVLGYEMLNFKERTFKPLRKEIGFVFQDPAASFNPQLTIGDCVAEPLVIHTNPSPAQARKRVGELLESVQLPASYADRFPHELSPAGSASAHPWRGR